MSGMAIGLSVFAGLMVLLVFRVHVGIGMFFAGSAAFLAMNQGDFSALLFTLNNLAYARLSNYDLAVIPLFMLMGQFATNGGLSKSLFRCAAAFIGHFRGGSGHGGNRGVCGVRCHLRFIIGHSSHHGPGCIA
jgi:C4-dicarboxylate transporter DctM subunit